MEATKFTEVGYVGRDVEQIVRDLVDTAILDTREHMREDVKAKAREAAEERVVTAIAGTDAREATREMFRKKLKSGELDDTVIELDLADTSSPLGMMAACHCMAAAANFFVLEFHGREIPWWSDLCDGDKPFIQDGYMAVSDKPGIGVELDEGKLEEYRCTIKQLFG